jgi:hypothetical protein
MTVDARLWPKVDKTGANGCWLWLGSTVWDGYGRFRLPDRTVRAHRFIYERFYGRVPLGMELDHLCRNRACVNPDHLEVVTPQQNKNRGYPGRRVTSFVRPKRVTVTPLSDPNGLLPDTSTH